MVRFTHRAYTVIRCKEHTLRKCHFYTAFALFKHTRLMNHENAITYLKPEQPHSPIRIIFRLPNWLGDVCMALPIIRGIQTKHPDAHYAFLVQAPYIDLLEKLGIEGEKIALPKKNWRYFFHFLRQREAFDAHILFTNSERGDVEAWLMRSRQRYGIARPSKARKLLTHRYSLTADFDEESLHQTHLWRDFAQSFAWLDSADYSPCLPVSHDAMPAVGLICGSANTPEKRWPSENWQALITQLLARSTKRIVLIGTRDDAQTCEQIAQACDDERVENWAGKTNLAELCDVMRSLSLVIGNDTGGLHLANALGVPVIGLYGYTNPVRCHPIFDAPVEILQSPKGFGEGSMADITVEQVWRAVTQ